MRERLDWRDSSSNPETPARRGAEGFLQEGLQALDERRQPAARNAFMQAVLADPQCDRAWQLFASATDSLEMRLVYLGEAVRLNPDNARAVASLRETKSQFAAELLIRSADARTSGDLKQSRSWLLQAAQLDPCSEGAWLGLSELDDPPEDVEFLLERVLQINPDNKAAHARLEEARARRAANDVSSHSQEPVSASGMFRFETCPLCDAGLDSHAEKCGVCNGILSLAAFVEGVDWRRRTDLNRGKLLLAVSRYSRLLNEDSRDASLYYKSGLAFLNLGRLDAAVQRLQRAAELSDDAQLAGIVKSLTIVRGPTPVEAVIEQPQLLSLSGDSAGGADRPTILVIDDSPMVRKAAAQTLEKSGYRVIEAADSVQGLAKSEQEGLVLVLVDSALAGTDGYQMCHAIKARQSELPIILMCGKDALYNQVLGKVVGVTGRITKPFDARTLVQTVRQFCLQQGKTAA